MMGAMGLIRLLTRLIRPNQGKAKFMKPNETPPEMVWIGGRWLLKSAVDKVNAENEEARRVMLANMQPRQRVGQRGAESRVARAKSPGLSRPPLEPPRFPSSSSVPSGGPADSPSQHPAPGACFLMGPIEEWDL